MTDITELARRVEHIISDMKLKHGDKDTYAPVMKWDEFLALVEALEKAQETIAFQQGEIKALLSSLESRTVTVKLPLPRRKTADDYVDDTFEPCDLAAVYNACRLECEVKFKNALTAAGIKVEAE